MAYYKVRIEDWNPAESDLEEIVQNTSTGEAICTKQEVVAVVDRPQKESAGYLLSDILALKTVLSLTNQPAMRITSGSATLTRNR